MGQCAAEVQQAIFEHHEDPIAVVECLTAGLPPPSLGCLWQQPFGTHGSADGGTLSNALLERSQRRKV